MSYSTRDDLVPALMTERQLAVATNGGSGSATVEVEAVTASKIAEADAEIDAYIGRRYDLPLTEVPALLTKCSALIARYRLLTIAGAKPNEQIRTDYEDVVKMLKDIRDGKLSLGLTASAEDPEASRRPSGRPQFSYTEQNFSRAKLGRY